MMESFKHAYGWRTQLGDLDFEPEAKAVYQKIMDPKFCKNLATTKVKDDTTFNDYGYYGGSFVNQKDQGTANIAVLHPSGDAITVTSTVNS